MIRLRDITASYVTERGPVPAVDGVSADLHTGMVVGIAGESGSGKTTLMRVLYGDICYPLRLDGGHIEYLFGTGEEPEVTMENIRSRWFKKVSYIPQSSMSSLNPVRRIKHQFTDFLALRGRAARTMVLDQAREYLRTLGLSPAVLDSYPHQLSGGMRQRVMIGLAAFLHPDLIIADEPTSALDVVVQKGILTMLADMQKQMGNTIFFVSHDIGVHFQISNRMAIMYAGRIVELADTPTLYQGPSHPYTKMLIESLPRIGGRRDPIASEGGFQMSQKPGQGCRFAHRCPRADALCVAKDPPLAMSDPGHYHACHHPYV